VLIFLAIAIALVAAGFMAWYIRRRAGTPTEPPGDWWPEFERAFRAYATHDASPDHTINRKEG
jgi:hypothetical protein